MKGMVKWERTEPKIGCAQGGKYMIGCIISFVVGSFVGAMVMALCAASKNSNVTLEDTGENVSENKDVATTMNEENGR
ncbi:hypothetical protein [uncultured Robinsoniella sp.]|uniref:hypothetical protein n=1 Tax=uncultured Robinsoniella sp. TaxID=904190 RepID=UPI00374FDA7C